MFCVLSSGLKTPQQTKDKAEEQERARLEAERVAREEEKAREDAIVRAGAKLMQVRGITGPLSLKRSTHVSTATARTPARWM